MGEKYEIGLVVVKLNFNWQKMSRSNLISVLILFMSLSGVNCNILCNGESKVIFFFCLQPKNA